MGAPSVEAVTCSSDRRGPSTARAWPDARRTAPGRRTTPASAPICEPIVAPESVGAEKRECRPAAARRRRRRRRRRERGRHQDYLDDHVWKREGAGDAPPPPWRRAPPRGRRAFHARGSCVCGVARIAACLATVPARKRKTRTSPGASSRRCDRARDAGAAAASSVSLPVGLGPVARSRAAALPARRRRARARRRARGRGNRRRRPCTLA